MEPRRYETNACGLSEIIEHNMIRCRLCPRNCGVNRLAGERGYCGESAVIRAARASLHMWEEPCISGGRGSGTVFFTGCPLGCVYCQNGSIAKREKNADINEADSSGSGNSICESKGSISKRVEITPERLAEIFLEQQERGANNINLVTPTHFVPQLVKSLTIAKDDGLAIPVVYNTGSYEKTETIRMLEGLVDVYLPDLKYIDADLARHYSNAPDYSETAKAAIAEMVRQAGTPVFARGREDVEDGIMLRGVIVRHLMLPGCMRDSKDVINYLHSTYGNGIYISIMNQYTPVMGSIGGLYPELDRKITRREYDRLVDYAINLGVENGFIQEGETAQESFIPVFDGRNI